MSKRVTSWKVLPLLLGVALTSSLLLVGTPSETRAGGFIFAGEANGVNVITHPQGYGGAGGVVNVSVCIDPTSTNAAAMAIPVQNAIATWNAQAATTPNLIFGAGNNIPATAVDFESAVLHEIGHCIGLAHVNLATESGLLAANRNYTKSTDGANNTFDINAGVDTIIGSSDDVRGDDVNLHWYVNAVNNPCNTIVGTNDSTTMSRVLANLPAGQLFATNGDLNVCANLGFANTEAVMQQGQRTDEDQRELTGDGVRTLRLGMSGSDAVVGGGDDYTINLTYAGMVAACNIPIDFDNTQTGFAVCQAGGVFLNPTHVAINSANIFFNTGATWFFNNVLFEPPVCDADGPYTAECDGTSTTLTLDGSGSSDPEDGTPSFAWTSDCPSAAFDDDTSSTPQLTVDSSPGCAVSCNVSLTVTDSDNNSVTCGSTVSVEDTEEPDITCPADVTLECDESTDPSNTGTPTSSDVCDPNPTDAFSDSVAAGVCAQESVITRTWTATDECGISNSCDQTITVEDTTAPVISCNSPATIIPPDAPISFTATAVDNCEADPLVEITGFDCFKFTRKGKRISKLRSCVIQTNGPTITIEDSGGVGDNITWDVRATDDCGNFSEVTCALEVINPGQGN